MRSPNLPETLSVEITSRCNHRCVMCAHSVGPVSGTTGARDISPAVWERVVEVAPAIGFVNVNGRGENLCHPRFLDYLAQLDSRGVRTSFATNGSLVNETVAERLVGLENLANVNFSVESPDPQLYATIHGARIEPVLEGIKEVVRRAPRTTVVTVSSVVQASTYASLREMPELLERLGVRTYILKGVLDTGGGVTEARLTGNEILALIRRLQFACERRGISVGVHPLLQSRAERRSPSIWQTPPNFPIDTRVYEAETTVQCGAPWEHPLIDLDGTVAPCCIALFEGHAAKGKGHELGSLATTSFAEVWSGTAMRDFREAVVSGRPARMCRSCPVASKGPHFFKWYRAGIDWSRSGCEADVVFLRVRNTGTATWDAATKLKVGTVRPRDRASGLAHASWPSSSRAACLSYGIVAPGEFAELTFRLGGGPFGGTTCPSAESFQLLIEDLCWLPDTEFSVRRAAAPLDASIAHRFMPF